MELKSIKVGDTVYAKTQDDAFSVGRGFVEKITTKTPLTVLLVVLNAKTHNEKSAKGVVLRTKGEVAYPYVWDARRFSNKPSNAAE